MFANMHNHSTFSDGVYTPEEIVKMAKDLGYKAIVLSDHDTVQGTYFMQKAARKEGLLTLLGCEFSTIEYGVGFHLLGFDFNPDEPGIRKLLDRGAGDQKNRTQLLLQWAQEKGRCMDVSWVEVCEEYSYNDYLCNNHIFNILVKKGVLKQEQYFEFFDPDFKWSQEKGDLFVKLLNSPLPSTKEVIAAIRKAGGVPVLAHPHNQLQYIPDLVEAGLMGVETNHPELTDEEILQADKLADRFGLYKTGGTDHNGVLGGFEWMNPGLKCDLSRNSVSKDSFMSLYQRQLG